MKRIISVSRRTDIPAFYGDWFMTRLKEGFAGVVNPFGGQKYLVSLRPEDVSCFVFWSKDFTPFVENLKIIERLGYKFYFNYTVTGLPHIFEGNLDRESAIRTLKQLSRTYSPKHINWRFDPIVISNICDRDFFVGAFETLAGDFAGLVERCYFSFVTEYGKVIRNFERLEKNAGVKIEHPGEEFKVELANELARIAEGFGIQMYSCCGDYLIGQEIKKAHCIDGKIIESLFFRVGLNTQKSPQGKNAAVRKARISALMTPARMVVFIAMQIQTSKEQKKFLEITMQNPLSWATVNPSLTDGWQKYNHRERNI